jgi:hypothetical protein
LQKCEEDEDEEEEEVPRSFYVAGIHVPTTYR